LNQHDSRQVGAWTAGIWLIGLGIMFATRLWLPGILVLVGITAIVRDLAENQGARRTQRGLWAILIGVWMALRFNMGFLLIALGVLVICKSIFPPVELGKKPYFDNRLE
jgi:hypothetical protein